MRLISRQTTAASELNVEKVQEGQCNQMSVLLNASPVELRQEKCGSGQPKIWCWVGWPDFSQATPGSAVG